MSPRTGWKRDRQLQLVVGIWALLLVDAVRQGISLPTSEVVAHWPRQAGLGLLAFAVLAPPILVAANHFLPLRGGWADWPQRLIDRRFGEGAANRFWVRLRPLWLMSAATFLLGGTGYVASRNADSASGSSVSILFVGFGVGFLVGALLEGRFFSKPDAA